MSDDLIISGSGSVAVAVDELYASAQQLRELAREAASMRAELASIDRMVSLRALQAVGAPSAAARAEADLDQAGMVLTELELQARAIDGALGMAADGYGFAEHVAGGLLGQAGGGLGYLFGKFAPGLLLTTGGVATLGALSGLALGGIQRAGGSTTEESPHEENWLLTNPLTVSLIRQLVGASPQVLEGMTGLPLGITELLAGMGLATTATTLMRGGSLAGLLKETPVQLASSRPQTVEGPPSGYAERLDRIPDPSQNGGSQVVIEKYSEPGQPDRFEVYVAGTVTFSPVADSEPWDMTSNLANAAGDDGGSYASVAEAMRLAGVDEDSPVQFTGYSQGGGTVARLVASGDYNTQGVTTFGGPTGQIPMPPEVPAVIVEHVDDLVPALGGEQANLDAVLVRRDVFAGRDIPTDHAVPAHHREYYLETARLMDQAQSQQITAAAAKLDGFTQGATTVTSTAYRFERVPVSATSTP